jgi:hypothetical protein
MSIPFAGIMMRLVRRKAIPLSSVLLQSQIPNIPALVFCPINSMAFVRQLSDRLPNFIATKATLFMGQNSESQAGLAEAETTFFTGFYKIQLACI